MTYVIRVLFVIGLACSLFGFKEARLAFNGTKEPEQVTLAALGATDGTSNVHLTVSDFQFGEGVVFEEKNGRWTQIWIPLVEPGEKWTPRPIVVNSNDVKSEHDLNSLVLKTELTGVITGGLGSKQSKQFAAMYPQTDLKNALVLDLDKSFPSTLTAVGLLVIGVIALLVAAGLFFGFFERKDPQLQKSMQFEDSPGSGWAEEPQDKDDERYRN